MGDFKGMIVPVTALQQNCAVLWNDASKRGTVIDPGGDADLVIEAIDQAGIAIEQILLTHGHIDHAGGAAELKEKLEARQGESVPVVGPDRRDAFLLEGLEEQGRQFGLEGSRNVVPDRWLEEGDRITIAGIDFDVLHCPGHTPGHLVYHASAANLLIGGDCLFNGSIGRTDFPYGDHDALITAIREKLYALPDNTTVLCGHGPGTSIGQEKRSNPFVTV